MISTNFMIGGGFMKCMPITRSGRFTAAPIAVMLIDEVLVASTTPPRQARSRVAKISRLVATSSVAASTTKSTASSSPPYRSQGSMRASICAATSAPSLFFSTSLASCWPTAARPRSAMSRPTSASVTEKPCAAASWAIPRPICPAPITPTRRMPSRIAMFAFKVTSDTLDRQSDPLAAADAERRDATPFAGVAQRREQSDQHPCTRSADRVAERDRPAPDVHPPRVEPQHPVVGDGDDRERLVDLPEIDVLLLPAVARQQPLDRARWRGGEPLGRLREPGGAHDARDRLPPPSRGDVRRRQDQRRGPIIDRRRVPRRDGPVLLKRRAQRRQLSDVAAPRLLVVGDHQCRAFLLWNLHRDDLGAKFSLGLRPQRPAVRLGQIGRA